MNKREFYDLCETLELAGRFIKTEQTDVNGLDRSIYQAAYRIGDFGPALFDYGVGIVFITVYVNSALVMSISTIDDGVWQAWGEGPLSPQKAKDLVGGLTSEYGGRLPTEEDLNKSLSLYGIYGMKTG